MSENRNRKIPVTERQFLWVQDDDKGEVVLHVGPTMVSPTAADRVVIDDGEGGLREDVSGRPQRMVELSDGQYAVLHNPLLEADEGSNGKFRPGRNESRPLKNGTRHMIPGPCPFFLRPGQRVEIRDAHELGSNQYLVVKVYGEVDRAAPYYAITARSATITTATAEDTVQPQKLNTDEPLENIALTRGQLIVIRGLDTQFYIPPTGVDVVPDLSVDSAGTRLTADVARKLLRSMPAGSGGGEAFGSARQEATDDEALAFNDLGLAPEEMVQQMVNIAVEEKVFEDPAANRVKHKVARRKVAEVEQGARMRQAVMRPGAPAPEPEPATDDVEGMSRDEINLILSSEVHRRALEREVRKARLVRQAVVFGEKEFCVILDADGKKQIKVGPARVFPGPYDSFMTAGSDNRVYYAYELLPQRGLWLRFIAPISLEQAVEARSRAGSSWSAAPTQPGDELILTGVNSFFFPFNEIEILHPLTGQPHVGNDHSRRLHRGHRHRPEKRHLRARPLHGRGAAGARQAELHGGPPQGGPHHAHAPDGSDGTSWIAENEPHKRITAPSPPPGPSPSQVPHNMASWPPRPTASASSRAPASSSWSTRRRSCPWPLHRLPKTDKNARSGPASSAPRQPRLRHDPRRDRGLCGDRRPRLLPRQL
jgi:major vault protein